jgi:hypothetical protein
MTSLPTWVTESTFVKESRATFDDLPQDIQLAVLYPTADPYELLKALTFFLYYVVPSWFLSFMTDVDADKCLEGIDKLFLLQDVKDFQAMMRLDQAARMSHATAKGKVQWIIYLRQTGHPWDTSTCAAAAKHGHLACLQYLHTNGCPWDHSVPFLAAFHNHVDCLVYALDENCDVDDLCIWQGPAFTGNVDCMKLLVQRGVEMSNEACDFSAEAGNLSCLKFAFENGSEPYIALSEAAYNGHLPCLMYCHEQDFPDDAIGLSEDYFDMDPGRFHMAIDLSVMNALEAACYGEHLDCFRYLHEQGYTSDLNLCSFAAYNNTMDCLKYACEVIGDPLDFTVTLHGLAADFVGCVEYVHLERGCPWNKRILVDALKKGAYKSFKFAYENGCPLPAGVGIGTPELLPDWFVSSRLVRECAPVPATAILRCLPPKHRATILHPALPSALAKTTNFLEKEPISRGGDDDDEDDDDEEA